MPEDGRRYELLEGDLVVTPAPSTSHQLFSRNLQLLLVMHVEARQLGEVFDAPVDVLLDRDSVVQPDLLFIRRDRLGIVRERAIHGPPDLIVEILSPSTEQRDRGAKRALYAKYGVLHYWMVDPVSKTLMELVLEGQEYLVRGTAGEGAVVRTQLFPDLELSLARVFRPMLRPEP